MYVPLHLKLVPFHVTQSVSFYPTSWGHPGPIMVSRENPENTENPEKIRKKCRESNKNAQNSKKIQKIPKKSENFPKIQKIRKKSELFLDFLEIFWISHVTLLWTWVFQ